MMSAAVVGDVQNVKLLLKRGADPELRNEQGERAVDIALEVRHLEIVRILRQSKEVVRPNRSGRSEKL